MPRIWHGKAPPVDAFTGEDPECHFDDWLPTLKRAADWNAWTEGDLLLQLAGHLKGRARQEWGLLSEEDKATYKHAIAALRSGLDPGSLSWQHKISGMQPKRRMERLATSFANWSDSSNWCMAMTLYRLRL